MSYLNDVLLGVIEGITEFLPISSTGHLLLAEQVLGARSDAYNIVIQAGAILAVTLIYWRRLVGLVTGWNDPANRDYLLKLLTAFGITAVLGLVVKKLGFELPETVTPIAWALVIGGIWMLWAENMADRQPDRVMITWRVAVAVGIAQIVAGMFPGTSRSGATIAGALLMGADKRSAAEFSFFLAMPTMVGAFALDLYKNRDALSSDDLLVIGVGFIAAFVAGLFVVRSLLDFVSRRGFTLFAIWRIVVGTLGLIALLIWG